MTVASTFTQFSHQHSSCAVSNDHSFRLFVWSPLAALRLYSQLTTRYTPLSSQSFLEGSGQLRDLDTVMGKARYFGERWSKTKALRHDVTDHYQQSVMPCAPKTKPRTLAKHRRSSSSKTCSPNKLLASVERSTVRREKEIRALPLLRSNI